MKSRSLASFALVALFSAPALAQETPRPPIAPPEHKNAMEERTKRLRDFSGTFTADTAAARARATSLDVVAKQEAVRAASARVDQAVVGFFPRLSGVARYAHLSALPAPTGPSLNLVTPLVPQGAGPIPPGTPLAAIPLSFPVVLDTWLFQGTVTVPVSDYVLRTSQSYGAAARNADAARFDRVAAEAKAQADARLVFYQWVKASGQKEVLEQALVAAEEHKKDAENLFKAGMTSKADVMTSDANLASGKLAVDQADELVRVAEDQLRTLTHMQEGEKIALGEDVTQALPQASHDLAALRQEALANRPELASLVAAEQSLEKNAAVARAGEYPRLDAFGDYIYANPNTRVFPQEAKFHGTWDVGLQLTWTANDAFTSAGAGAEIEASAAKLRAQRAQLRDAVLSEVTQSVLAARTADTAVETGVLGLAAAEEAYRVRRELYRVGKATSVELTDAESNLFRARLVVVSARIDQRIARVRIDHAAGRDAQPPARGR